MSKAGRGFWWPQLAGYDEPKQAQCSSAAPQAEPIRQQQSSWPSNVWFSGRTKEVAPRPASIDATLIPSKDEEMSWWTRIVGFFDSTVTNSDNKTDTQLGTQTTASAPQTWLLWLLFHSEPTNDLESDIEDQSTAELYREAKLALETSKDSCHYALCGYFGSTDVELSVAGTSSGSRPVRYNPQKRPSIANEHFETTMAQTNLAKQNSPPLTTNTDQKTVLNTRNGRGNGRRKALNSSTHSPALGLYPPACELRSSDSSIRSGHLNVGQQSISGIFPQLSDNFRVITLATKLRLFSESLFYGDATTEKHLYTSTERSIGSKKKRLAKKAVVISLHSFLPTKFWKLIIGQSTGNALRFATLALEAIHTWLNENFTEHGHIQHISLEGFGTMNSRVEKSFELLKNWTHQINEADFVFFVANSIAAPTLFLLAQKIMNSETFNLFHNKIGLMSIAGTNLGPFLGLDTKVVVRAYTQNENEIINELFELQKPTSAISNSVNKAIQSMCARNVKITLVGSVSDQFVPLCSSLHQRIRHPNIFRCVYVEENSEVPPFIVQLISLVLTMENMGHGDHNLLWHLLAFIKGAVQVSGSQGIIHSDPDCYEVGVRFALETTSVRHHRDARESGNYLAMGDAEKSLYHLPWCVRGVLNDLMNIKNIRNLDLLESLRNKYLCWEPTTRHWRTVKHCFAAFEDLTVNDILL